jgi:hypothetical protein
MANFKSIICINLEKCNFEKLKEIAKIFSIENHEGLAEN